MKKYIFALMFSFLFLNKSYSAIVEFETVRSSITKNNTNGVMLTTGIIVLESVTVISTGSGGSSFSVFDATVLSTTTNFPTLHPSTSAATRTYEGFSGNTIFDYPFSIVFSSGIHYNNLPPTGASAPTLHFRYKIKHIFGR